MATPELVEDVDYYMEDGKMVMTAYFLLKRGHCCNSGCRNCPYKGGEMPKANVTIKGLPTPLEADAATDSASSDDAET